MSIALRFAARSDIGLGRETNQDSGYAGPDLLVLADGMGGAAGGDIASSVAVAHLAPLDGESHRSEDLLDRLRTALGNAHQDLVTYSTDHSELKGLGTTVIALLRSGSRVGMVHIGDSRAYLLRDDTLTQVTSDHTFVQHLIDAGEITPEQAEDHPQRSAILRVLGDMETSPVLDESVREIRPGDRWLLCSDGLSGPVSAETLQRALSEQPDPGKAADDLIDLALRAGGQDNITVVIADVIDPDDGDDAFPDTSPQIVGAAAKDRARPTRGGGGASGRAAALRPSSPEDPPDDLDDGGQPRRRLLTWVLSTLIVLAILAGAGTIAYRWTQTQYYVAPDDAFVAIYQGIPQNLGPVHFSDVHERTDLELDSLPEFARNRVERTMTADSLQGAEAIVADLRSQSSQDDASGGDS